MNTETKCSIRGCAAIHTPATCPVHGSLVNQIRKLQRSWDYWHPQRQLNPIMASDTMQQTAERFCERIGPKLHDLKQRLAALPT